MSSSHIPGRRWFRRLTGAVALAAALTTLPGQAGALADPYGEDPLRLIPFAGTVQRVYSQGSDDWEVWICRIPGSTLSVNASQVAANLNSIVTPYYQWLSRNRYLPVFRVGGEVTSTDPIPTGAASGESFQMPGCEEAVSIASPGTNQGALIVVAAEFSDGYATAGAVCPEVPFTGCLPTYPANFRRAVVGGGAVTSLGPGLEPQWSVVAHEIGHALNWPHSYGGLTTIPNTTETNTYDNPMDVMSGGARSGIPVGAIAYHRYAAGWIDPAEVATHRSGIGTYRLASNGAPGTQMLVLPLTEEGHYYLLDARRRSSYDSRLPQAGVEVYEVDQRAGACQKPAAWPSTWPCFATLVRVTQRPAVADPTSTAHVLGIDEELIFGPFTVRVQTADEESFTVQVSDERVGVRFIDDDGNPHEPDIEAIAALGITKGCNPPLNDRFCPAQTVTRAEMAAFLIRAVGEEANLPAFQGYFSDVPSGQWFTPYVERLSQLGITQGTAPGRFSPGVPVTRAEMAVFLIRAFDDPGSLGTPAGLFADVPIDAWYAAHTEVIYALGITLGCSTDPLSYCPLNPVRRDEMASFIARAQRGGL